MIAIALDPGKTTGFATGNITDGEMLVVTAEEKLSHMGLWNYFGQTHPAHIICERFDFRHGKRKDNPHGLELYSRELIGIINLYSEIHGNCKIHMQPPMKSNPTTFFNDAKLKEYALWKSGKGHANDAVRHLLYWFQFGSGFKFNEKGFKSGVLA